MVFPKEFMNRNTSELDNFWVLEKIYLAHPVQLWGCLHSPDSRYGQKLDKGILMSYFLIKPLISQSGHISRISKVNSIKLASETSHNRIKIITSTKLQWRFNRNFIHYTWISNFHWTQRPLKAVFRQNITQISKFHIDQPLIFPKLKTLLKSVKQNSFTYVLKLCVQFGKRLQ